MNDKNHVEAAVRMFPHADDSDKKELAKRIIRKAHEFGMDTSKWESLNKYIQEADIGYITLSDIPYATATAGYKPIPANESDINPFALFDKVPLNDFIIDKYKSKTDMSIGLKHLRMNDRTKGFMWLNQQDEVVGYVAVEQKDIGPYIIALELSPKYQGRGLGKALLDFAENYLGGRYLSVSKKNERAFEMYKSCGWNVYDETPKMYFMKKDDASQSFLTKESFDEMIEGWRFTYKGQGIYQALKNAMWQITGSSKAWIDFKNSEACSWLPEPPSYGSNDRSYFTKLGYDTFMERTFPIMKNYLDENDIKISHSDIPVSDIVYKDQYQFITDKPMWNKNVDNLPEGITLRPATEDDIPNMFKWKLESVDKRIQTDPKTIKFIENNSRESVWNTRMIMYNDDTIGMLTTYTVDDGYWYIDEIYIIEEYRGRGIGRALLEKEISEHDKLSLKVAKDNTSAFKLYQSLGFEVYDETDYSYDMKLDKTNHIQEGVMNDIKNGVNPKSKRLFFHISMDTKMNGKTLKPRIPTYLTKKDNVTTYKENATIPRVCFSPSIEGCLNAIISAQKNLDVVGKNIFVYIPEKPISEYKIKTNKEIIKEKLVFDANATGEMWILEPVKLKLYGVIMVDQVKNIREKPTINGDPHGRCDYKWHWAVKPKYVEKTLEYLETYDDDSKKKKTTKE